MSTGTVSLVSGWMRPSGRHRWRLVAEGAEPHVRQAVQAEIAGLAAADTLVLPLGKDPNAKRELPRTLFALPLDQATGQSL